MAIVKTKEEIRHIASAGEIVGAVLRRLKNDAKEGVNLLTLEVTAKRLIEEAGAKPSFLGYMPGGAVKPYPAVLCTSINDVIVHGVPSNYRLKNGDILKLDLGAVVKGYHADAAITVAIGQIGKKETALIAATEEALHRGIAAAKPGNRLGDIGHAIQSYIRKQKLFIAEGLTGHGIGQELHEDPSVHNTGKKGTGMFLKEGMTLAIEPMVAMGTSKMTKREDDSYATRDGSMSAHFEHTIVIEEAGARILTL